MGLLQRFENRVEQVVSGAFAKAFRSAVQPVELSAALQREVDNSAQVLSRDRRLVPNSFHIELSPVDHARLEPYGDTLAAELTDLLRQHADEQHYVFAGPVTIAFHQAEDLGTGRFRVRSQASAQVSTSRRPDRRPPPSPEEAVPAPAGPRTRVVVEVNGTRHPLEAPGLLVGRGTEADLRINDPGVSRTHAEFRVMPGSDRPLVTVVDLGSTNGTIVNGHRVDHAAVTDGTTIRVGNTMLVVRVEQGDDGVE